MAYTPPDANTVFNKITPEKVWNNTDDAYWVSVNGGTVTGNLTVNGDANVTGVLTANRLIATGATTLASCFVTGDTTLLGSTTSGTINQGVVGFPSFAFGPALTGTVLNPLQPSTTSSCALAMACTAVTQTIAGYVSFTVNNNWAFATNQSIVVSGTTNWNGTYQVYSFTPTTLQCTTASTFASEPGIDARITPLFNAGMYAITAVCKITQSVAPTSGSATEGVSIGMDINTSAPANYTQTIVQTTSNLLNTITGVYGQATFTMAGTVRCSATGSRVYIVLNTGALTGTYAVSFPQITVKPVGVYRA